MAKAAQKTETIPPDQRSKSGIQTTGRQNNSDLSASQRAVRNRTSKKEDRKNQFPETFICFLLTVI